MVDGIDGVAIDGGGENHLAHLVTIEHEGVTAAAVRTGVVDGAHQVNFLRDGVAPANIAEIATVVNLGGTFVTPVVLHNSECIG